MGKFLTLKDGTEIFQQKKGADYSLKIISTLPKALEPYLLYHPLVARSKEEPVGRRGPKAKAAEASSSTPTPNPHAKELFEKCLCSSSRTSRSLSSLFIDANRSSNSDSSDDDDDDEEEDEDGDNNVLHQGEDDDHDDDDDGANDDDDDHDDDDNTSRGDSVDETRASRSEPPSSARASPRRATTFVSERASCARRTLLGYIPAPRRSRCRAPDAAAWQTPRPGP